MHMWDRYEIQDTWIRAERAQECASEKAPQESAAEQATEKASQESAVEQAPEKASQESAQKMWLMGSSKVVRVFHAGQQWELPE